MNKLNPKSFSDLLFGETELKTQEQINESGLSRVWSHTENHDCGMISACRGDKSEEQNNENSMKLKAKMLTLGYGVTKIDDNYIEDYNTDNAKKVKELSWFVVDIDDKGTLKQDLIKLGRIYQQDSIAFGAKASYWVLVGTNNSDFPGFNKEVKLSNKKFGKAGEFFSSVKGRPFMFESIIDDDDFEFKTFKKANNMGKWYLKTISDDFDKENPDFDKQDLNESSLSRIYNHINNYDCATITAFRGELSLKENKENNKTLKQSLLNLGFGVTNIKGGFVEKDEEGNDRYVDEESYFVVNLKDIPTEQFFDFIKKLGKRYNQDSVMLGYKETKTWVEFGLFARYGLGELNKFNNVSYEKFKTYYSKIGNKHFTFESYNEFTTEQLSFNQLGAMQKGIIREQSRKTELNIKDESLRIQENIEPVYGINAFKGK